MSRHIKREVSQKRISGKPLVVDFKMLWKDRNLAIPLVFILVLTALLYAHVLQNGFLGWDDPMHVQENKDIQSLSMSNIQKICSSSYGGMYHPLTTLTFAVEYQLFGLNPTAYHATNLLFHLANVVLVFFFVFRLSNRREIAIIAACLFGIHPMHVESVAWITERKDVVYAFFYLIALICYIRFIQREGKKYYWLTFLFFVLSLFSKTTAATLPVVLLLIDFYLHRKVKINILIEKIPLFILSIVFGYIALQTQSLDANYDIRKGLEFADRIFLLSYSVCYYIIHLFIPIKLSVLHLLPEKLTGMLPVEYYLAVIPILFIVLLTFKKGIFQHELVFGLSFFIVAISLSVHLIPFSYIIVAERFTYIPYIGLYYIIGQFYCFVIDSNQNLFLASRKVILISASFIAALLSYIAFERIGVWKDTITLFDDATMKANSTKEANYIQAIGYECEAGENIKAYKFVEAIKWYDKAIAIDSLKVESYTNRGIAKHYLRDYEGAMKDYTKAIQLNPSIINAYPNRAEIYLLWNKRDAACADLRMAYNLGLYDVFETMHIDCP